jgi:SAM-dependent methyltransferase
MTKYRKAFYRSLESQGLNSAREVLPFLRELFDPKSVVDVGCGTGEWLSVWRELGVDEITGVDFQPGEILNIPSTAFIQQDLTQPFSLPRQYDLAMSLEVGEHLPPESAEVFVGTLTQLAPIVFFSAAIPSQGGTGHINEQWPDYWAALFEKFDYVALDILRPRFWDNSNVTGYYAQNMVLYVKRGYQIRDLPSFNMQRFVHPGLFQDVTTELRQLRPLFTSRGLVKRLPAALWLSISDRVKNTLDR